MIYSGSVQAVRVSELIDRSLDKKQASTSKFGRQCESAGCELQLHSKQPSCSPWGDMDINKETYVGVFGDQAQKRLSVMKSSFILCHLHLVKNKTRTPSKTDI